MDRDVYLSDCTVVLFTVGIVFKGRDATLLCVEENVCRLIEA